MVHLSVGPRNGGDLVRSHRRELIGLALFLIAATAGLEAWRSHLDNAFAPRLAQAARPGDIQLLSSVTCVFCTRARQWLHAAKVPFDECFIERDADCAARFNALGAPGTPVVLVRGQAQLGFTPERVAQRLEAPRQAQPR